jgi:hypothetical protein
MLAQHDRRGRNGAKSHLHSYLSHTSFTLLHCIGASDSDDGSGDDDSSLGEDSVAETPRGGEDTLEENRWVFSREQLCNMKSHLVDRSTTKGTAAGYQRGIRIWRDYVNSSPPGRNPGLFLQNVTRKVDKARHLVLFSMHLMEEKKLIAYGLLAILTHLRYYLEVNLKSTSFFNEGLVKRARSAAGYTVEETRTRLMERTLKSILPLIMPMLQWLRDNFWGGEDCSWSTKEGLDRRLIYLTVCLGFDSGPRISNLVKPDRKAQEDHGMRAGAMEVSFRRSVGGELEKLVGGRELHTALQEMRRSLRDVERAKGIPARRTQTCFPQVERVDFKFVTSKTTRKVRTTVPREVALMRRSPAESRLVDDLLWWVYHSPKLVSSDYLFVRYDPKKDGVREGEAGVRQPRRKEVAEAIKKCAAAFRFDPARFSTKSMRVGFATFAESVDMPVLERNDRGGWAVDSIVPVVYYAHRAASRGAFAMAGDPGSQMEGFTMDDLQRSALIASGHDGGGEERLVLRLTSTKRSQGRFAV